MTLPSNVLQAGGPCVPFFRRAASQPPNHSLVPLTGQTPTGHQSHMALFQNTETQEAHQTFAGRLSKLEPRCPDVSKTHHVFFCSAKQRPLYSDTNTGPTLQSPQPGGDVPRVPAIKAAAQSCADYTLCTGAPNRDLKSSQALKLRPTPPHPTPEE